MSNVTLKRNITDLISSLRSCNSERKVILHIIYRRYGWILSYTWITTSAMYTTQDQQVYHRATPVEQVCQVLLQISLPPPTQPKTQGAKSHIATGTINLEFLLSFRSSPGVSFSKRSVREPGACMTPAAGVWGRRWLMPWSLTGDWR